MHEKKKALVILTPGFPCDEKDTTCIPFLQEFVFAFLRLHPEIELHVIAFQYPYKEGHYKWNGAHVYSAGGKNTRLARLSTWNRVNRQLKKLNKEKDVLSVHSFWLTEAAFIGQKFAKRNKLKHIAWCIGQDALKKNKYLGLLKLDEMNIVATSKQVVDTLYSSTGVKANTIIPAGLDAGKFKIAAVPRTIDLLGVGALSELKNYGLFIDIIAELRKDINGIKAVIIGKGEQEKMLREKIKALGLEKNVEMVNELPHPEVINYMNRSKILLHTSSYEGQSTVILEAMAIGMKVVCFNVGRVNSPNIKVCSDKKGMIGQIRTLLSQSSDYKPEVLQTSDDTVKEFYKLYTE
jgi:glycosyltransferase involved in cell wall biosynthesis